jgi:hypothetical protein
MKYLVALPSQPTNTALFAQMLQSEDPGAMIDRAPDAPALRLSTCLAPRELQALAAAAGMALGADAIEQLPSECCGGCSG